MHLSMKQTVLLLLIFLILLLAYWPVVSTDYLFHDDLYYSLGVKDQIWNRQNCDDYSQMNSFKNIMARPLGGYLRCFYGKYLLSIEDGKYLRLFNVGVLSLYAFLVIRWLCYCGIGIITASFTALFISLLTPYQTPIAQITNAYHLFAGLLAVVSLLILAPALEIRRFVSIAYVLSFILMAMSFLIYPPGAMLYWAYLSVYVLKRYSSFSSACLSNLVRLSLPAMVGMIIPKLWAYRYGMDARGVISHDLYGKITWFFNDVIPLSFSYWDAFPSKLLTFISLTILLLALMFKMREVWVHRVGHFEQVGKLVILLLLVPMTFLPNLIISESVANHRIILAIKTILFLYVACSISYLLSRFNNKGLRASFSAITVGILIYATCVTYQNMRDLYAGPSHLEYAYLKTKVIDNADVIENGKKIHFVTARLPYLATRNRGDEFGMPSTYWADDLFAYVMFIIQDLKINVSYHDIIKHALITAGDENKVISPIQFIDEPVAKKSKIVNMNNIHTSGI